MPAIVDGSIHILSDAGLGMAMFSLGEFACSSHSHSHSIIHGQILSIHSFSNIKCYLHTFEI